MQQAELHELQLQDATFAQGDYAYRHHDRAHRRFLSACKTFAQVRSLLGPSIQVNLADKQVKVARARLVLD